MPETFESCSGKNRRLPVKDPLKMFKRKGTSYNLIKLFKVMKKINFKNLSNDEILTREELKRITGGNGSDDASDDGSGGAAECKAKCTCPRGYQVKSEYGTGLFYYVTVQCLSGCSATDEVGVACTAPSDTFTNCDTEDARVCEKIPIQA